MKYEISFLFFFFYEISFHKQKISLHNHFTSEKKIVILFSKWCRFSFFFLPTLDID